MNEVDPRLAAAKVRSVLIGLALVAAAAGVLFFTSGFVFQAFRGPRSVTEQELLGITAPVSGENYVSFTPSGPFIDTGLQWGKKDNPGTKYLLLPVGDRLLLCSARIANNGPTFTGRLERLGGGTEAEVLNRVKGSDPGGRRTCRADHAPGGAEHLVRYGSRSGVRVGLGVGRTVDAAPTAANERRTRPVRN